MLIRTLISAPWAALLIWIAITRAKPGVAAPTDAKVAPVTVIQWQGRIHITGVFLASRVHVTYLNITCTNLLHDLNVAAQVADMLTQTKLVGANVHQAKRYGYLFLRLD